MSLCSRAEAIAPCATIISHTMVLVGALVESGEGVGRGIREGVGRGIREWGEIGEGVSAAF